MSDSDLRYLIEGTELEEYYWDLAEQLAYEQAMEDVLYRDKD